MDVKVLDEVHDYWFGELGAGPIPPELTQRWFRPTPEIDAHIRETFGPHLDEARATEWDLTRLTQRQQMGLIVLLDQFPRQIWRESGEAFAYDAKARSVARQMVDGGTNRFHPAERIFLYLPFEHSEDVADQDRAVLLYAIMAVDAPEEVKEGPRNTLDYATKHRDIIRKFGRFPHRNVMMGRESTPEEIEFLKGGRGF